MTKDGGRTNSIDINVEKLKTVAAVALAVVAVLGTVSVMVVAPNLISAIHKLYKLRGKPLNKNQAEKEARKALYYLKRTGVIRIRKTGQERWLELTSFGAHKYAKQTFETLRITRPKTWDKKWWLVAADIPSKTHRVAADYFRQKLLDMQFMAFQRTMWLYPYNPQAELSFVVEHFGLGQFVTLMEVSRLDKSDEQNALTYFRKLHTI